jgi:hypothetical protein
MAGFAFLFAPVAFANVGPTPAFAATIAETLRALTRAGEVFGIVAAAITAFARIDTPRVAAGVIACVALMLALGFVETQYVIPQMQLTPLQTPAYEALHKQSSTIYSIVLLSGLVGFVLAALPQRFRA